MSELVKTFVFDLQRFAISVSGVTGDSGSFAITDLSDVTAYTASDQTHTANQLYWAEENKSVKVKGSTTATVTKKTDDNSVDYYVVALNDIKDITLANDATTIIIANGSANLTPYGTFDDTPAGTVTMSSGSVSNIALTAGSFKTGADASVAGTYTINGEKITTTKGGFTYEVSNATLGDKTITTDAATTAITATGNAKYILPGAGATTLQIYTTTYKDFTATAASGGGFVVDSAKKEVTGFIFGDDGDLIKGEANAIKNLTLYTAANPPKALDIKLTDINKGTDISVEQAGTDEYTIKGFGATDKITLGGTTVQFTAVKTPASATAGVTMKSNAITGIAAGDGDTFSVTGTIPSDVKITVGAVTDTVTLTNAAASSNGFTYAVDAAKGNTITINDAKVTGITTTGTNDKTFIPAKSSASQKLDINGKSFTFTNASGKSQFTCGKTAGTVDGFTFGAEKDAITLDATGKNLFNATNIGNVKFGNNTFESTIDLSNVASAAPLLTWTSGTDFTLSNLQSADTITLKDGVGVAYTDAGGSVVFDAKSGELGKVNVTERGSVTVTGVLDTDVAINSDTNIINVKGTGLKTTDSFTYNYATKSNPTLTITAASTVSDLTISKAGDVKQINLPALSTTGGTSVTVGNTDMKVTTPAGGALTLDGKGAVNGFIFGATGTIVFDNGVPDGFKLYDTDTTKTIALPKITCNGIVAIDKASGTGALSVVVGSGAVVTDTKGKVLDFSEMNGTDFAQIVFDDKGVVSSVYSATNNPSTGNSGAAFTSGTEIKVKEDKATSDSEGLQFNTATSAPTSSDKHIATASGNYSFIVGADADHLTLKLTDATDTVYSAGKAKIVQLGGTEGTITYNKKDYKYTSGGDAYFKADGTNGTLTGFVFAEANDSIELPATFTLSYLNASGAETAISSDAPAISEYPYTVKMTDDTAFKFEISGIPAKAAVTNTAGNTTYFTFDKTATDTKNSITFSGVDGAIKGLNIAVGSVKIDATNGVPLLNGVSASTEADMFQLNGKAVNINAVAASTGLVYNATDKSLSGLTTGSTVVNSGEITKIFAAMDKDQEYTFGDSSAQVVFKTTATAKKAENAAFFTLKDGKVNGFTFTTKGDSILLPVDNMPTDFKLYDGVGGDPITAPAVYTNDTRATRQAITVVKGDPNFSIEGFLTDNYVELGSTKLTFKAVVAAAGADKVAVEFDSKGALVAINNVSANGNQIKVDGATGEVKFDSDAVNITGSSFVYGRENGAATITDVAAKAVIKATAGASVVSSATDSTANGAFTFGGDSKVVTLDGNVDGVKFFVDSKTAALTGISGITGTESVSGALNGLKFNDYAGTGTALAITGGDSTTYTLFGGGLSLAGLKSGEEVTATGGISTFITDGIGKFTVLKTGMSIADDKDNSVAFVTDGKALTGIESLNGSAIGDFTGGLSVNNVVVKIENDELVKVVGDDKIVTEIHQLGVTDATKAINVSASTATLFGVDGLGKFDFNGTAFGVSGTNTAETTFNLSASAITGIDVGEFVTGGFSTAAWTINDAKLQVKGDSAITIVNGASGIGFKDMASGASLAEGTGFKFAQTEGDGKFTFFGGQSFTVSNDKDGVTFLLDGKGKVSAVSGLEGTIVGDLNGVIIKNSDVAISVVGSDGKDNTSLTYANSTLSGIKNGDTIYLADSATKVITAGGSVTFKAPDGDQAFWTDDTALTFDVKSDAKGVTATAVSELDAGKKLEGAIAGLSVNTKLVDITNDKDFGVVGAAAGISAIYKLSDGAIVTDAAGATLASTDRFGTFTFAGGQSFITAGDSTVDFTLKDNAVTAINGLSGGSIIGNFDVLTGVNGQTFEVKNDSEIQVFAGADGKLSKIALVSGGASIGEIGSVSQILTDKAGEFVFSGGQSFTTAEDDNVTFGMSSSKVTSISELAGSVTGNFTGIKVNGATIDIIGDDEITVIGNGKALDEIQGVDADATINAAGSAVDLVGNISASSGKFTFKDSGEFVIAGDSSVTFELDATAAAKVTGISGIDGPATVTGGLSQVAFNGNSMSVAGDADNQFSYMLDAAGKATLGGVGGEKVTVSGVGGANFVQITEQGDYNFFGTAYGLSLASGESSVLFGTDGKQVTSVADLEGTLKGDFSATGFTVNGKEFEIAGDSSVGIVGSGSGVTKIVDLSGGANVKGVGGASVAITDSEGKFTFTNGSFSIAGDADGVTFMLDGDKVVGIKDLDTGATLTGSLDQLNTINGTTLDIKDDNNFGVVGATSGISKVVDLSTPANVVNAGGASQALANTGETFTFPNGTFTISGDSTATFDLNTDSEVTNIKVVSGATVSGPLNGIAINGGASLNVLNDENFGAVAGDSKLAQLINLSGGANVSEAGGASQFVTDQAGEFTILGTAMEIGSDDNVMFTAGTSGITAIDSLEGTAFGDFSNGILVNSNDVKVLGDSSIEVTSDGTAVTAIASVTGSDAPTIAAVGGATEIGTDAAGTFTFTTGSASQAFTVGDDDEVTFALDADGVVTGVNALEDGTLGFKDVTDLTVNETELTIESTQNVSLSIADSAVVYVQGVDGEIGGLENATVAATTAMTVNGTDINVQGDDDYKVIVQDGAVVGLTDVSAGATVNVAGVSIAVNESGDFQIGGNTYTFTDENNAFTLTTGDDSQLSGVDELQGNVVIAAPSTQSLAVNGDGIAFASNAEVVTVAAGASGITGVNGLVNKDGVSGDLNDAAIFMGGSSASVSTDGGALTVNDVTYTLLNDDNGITVTGGRVVTDLNENASLFVSEKGKYTVNGNTSDIEVEDTALPIIGLENASDAYIYDPAHILVGTNTPVSEIEQMLGLTTEYPADPNFGTAENPLDTAGLSAAMTQDLDKPLEIFATNDTKEPQDMNLAGTDFSKKVHLFDGPQSVEFNNFGANEAIIERENADGSATGGEKAITLGDGGDAVIMKADAGNGSAVDVTGGTGDDSVVVQGSAPVNFDMSQGGDDKIVTFAKSNARMTLEGYDALTNPNAGIHITERWASIANAILRGLLSFGDGLLNINNTSGDSAKIAFAGHTDPIGAVLVNLFDYLGRKQAVGFTNSGGGLADFSAAVEPMILIGNDGNKTGGSSLLGGSGDDTAFAGGGDEIDLGLGNNEIVLDPSTTREGAGIALTRGRTTIDNFNGTFNLDHGDVIATDLSAANISFRDGNVYIEGDGFYGVIADAKPDGAISYDEALTESADEAAPFATASGDYTNVLFNNAGVLVKTAIAKEGGVIDVKLDQDQRALNYIGDNSGLTFYDHTGEVLVNLADGNGSIDTADALFSGINSVAAGAGQTTIIGADDNETLIAGTGNGSIWGAGGDNLMRGNTDSGKTGQTSFFVVAEKDGARNTIESFNFVTDDNYTNTNKITADKLDIQVQYDQIQTENGGVAISGNDVVLLVNNRNEAKAESVIIKDAVGKDFIVSGDDIIDDVIAQVNVDKLTADKFANYFVATGKNATLTVSDEFDKANIYLDSETPLGSDHEGEIPQFYGDFKVIDATGSNAKVELGGNELDNTILAGTGDSSLWGGNGGNDLLVGGAGKNSFFYNYGNGNDTIQNVEDGDVIDLTNISLDDIVDANNAIGDNGVKLQFTDGNTLTVEGTAGEYIIGDDTYVVEDGKWSKKA